MSTTHWRKFVHTDGNVLAMPVSKWDVRFVNLAQEVASWSKDPVSRVGCVLATDDNRVLSIGYNGLPAGYDDDELATISREEKLRHVIHAELNAVLNANAPVAGCVAYVTHCCCTNCCAVLIQSKVSGVVWVKNEGFEKRYPAEPVINRLNSVGVSVSVMVPF